jgi:ArsR family transcriptional regulator
MEGRQSNRAVAHLRAVVSDPTTLRPLERESAESLAKTLRAVADPTRLQLLSMIQGSAGQEATVGDLAKHLGFRQPTITHHLRLMHEEGLLVREPRGRNVWYSIAPDRRSAIADLLR